MEDTIIWIAWFALVIGLVLRFWFISRRFRFQPRAKPVVTTHIHHGKNWIAGAAETQGQITSSKSRFSTQSIFINQQFQQFQVEFILMFLTGYRPSMEDEIIAEDLKNHDDVSLVAVLDGHCGAEASAYFKIALMDALNPLSKQELRDPDAIKKACLDLDEKWLNEFVQLSFRELVVFSLYSGTRFRQEQLRSSSLCTTARIRRKSLL